MNIRIPARLGFAVAVLAAPCLLSPALAARTSSVMASVPAAGPRVAPNAARKNFRLTSDSPVWIEQEAIPDAGDLNGNDFGVNVAVSGNTAIGGAPYTYVSPNLEQGSVYVYNRSGGTWSLVQQLLASDGTIGDHFGFSVALDGNTAVVGAPYKTVAGHLYRGAAYVFTRENGTWIQTAELTSPHPLHQERFGFTVAIRGHLMLISAPGDGVHGNGGVYAYVKPGGSWIPVERLAASDGSPGDGFGYALGVSRSGVLVGAPNADAGIGAAYFYSYAGGNIQETKLTPSDGMSGDAFGSAVALNGPTAVVGAPNLEVNGNLYEGAAYVFIHSGGTWSQTQKLIPPAADEARDDSFGSSLSLSGQDLLVGASGVTIQGQDAAGAGYLFAQSNGSWALAQKFVASNPGYDNGLGASAALDNSGLVLGAPNAGQWAVGAFYFYDDSALSLAVSAPASVPQGQNYVSQAIATNDSTAASPAVAVTVAVPAAATFVSASASQGSCTNAAGTVTCTFGQIAGGGGTATANVTLEATGNVGDTIENVAGIAKATPPVTASAPTVISQAPAHPRQ